METVWPLSVFLFKNASAKSLKGNEENELPIFEISFLRNITHVLKKYSFSLMTRIILCYKIFLIDQINLESALYFGF